MIEAFGEQFETVRALATSDKCRCSDTTLVFRIKRGWSPQIAATTPNQSAESCIVWGLGFDSLADVAKDPQCMVTFNTLKGRMDQGQDLLWAVSMPRIGEFAAWGELFKNLVELSEDSRCEVSYQVLRLRINQGIPPGIAASKNLPVAGR